MCVMDIHCQHLYACRALAKRPTPFTLTVMDYEQFMRALGKRIKALREAKELTQIQVSADSGLDQASISRVENGEQGLDSRALVGLANALNVPVSDLTAVENTLPANDTSAIEGFTVWKSWSALPEETRIALRQIVRLALRAKSDPEVAKHIRPAPKIKKKGRKRSTKPRRSMVP